MTGTGRAVLGLALLWSASPPPSLPQEETESGATFFETVEVNVVNVDVVVTDRHGDPVQGLTADDFTVYEDGEPVEVTSFYAVEPASYRAGELAPREEDDQKPTTEAADSTVVAAARRPLHLVVFVDELNITPVGRNHVLQRFRKLAHEALRPTDQVLVASFDGGLEVRPPLSGDPEKVIAVLEEIMKSSTAGALAGRDFWNALQAIGDVSFPQEPFGGPDASGLTTPPDAEPGQGSQPSSGTSTGFRRPPSTDIQARQAFSAIRSYAERAYHQAELALGGLTELLQSLSGIEGRKALLYVSDGLSVRPGETLIQIFEDRFDLAFRQLNMDLGAAARTGAGEVLRYDLHSLLERLVDEANAHRVTLYTLGTGSRLHSRASMVDDSISYSVQYSERLWSTAHEALETSNLFSSLKIMAEGTGGAAVPSAGNLDHLLGRLRSDFDSYYSLAYSPNHHGDGQHHRLEVRVSGPSWRVRHREGYLDKSEEARLMDRTRAALLLGEGENPLGLELDFGPRKREGKEWVVPVVVKIPMTSLTFVPRQQVHEGRLTLSLGVKDSQGRTSPVQVLPLPLRIPNQQLLTALGQMGGYNLEIKMRDGEHTVAVAARDEIANTSSTVTAFYRPPDDVR